METYRAFYLDASTDTYNGTYLNILAEYDPAANSPQDLRTKVYNSGNAGTPMSHLLLIRDPNLAGTGPGNIVAYHHATRYDARIGRVTPFDGVGYAFLGDVHNAQPPMTVILPDDLFNLAQVVQVPTAARIDQILAADNTLELIGPFNAGDPDIEAVTVRRIIYVPPRYLLIALDTSLTPREAWNQIRGAIVINKKEADCTALIDWLRVCLTRRGANDQPRTTVDPPMPQALVDPQFTRTVRETGRTEPSWGPNWASCRNIFRLDPSALQVPWRCYVDMSTPTSSASLDVGDQMKCCGISMYKQLL